MIIKLFPKLLVFSLIIDDDVQTHSDGVEIL
jgi:hypothetical protein